MTNPHESIYYSISVSPVTGVERIFNVTMFAESSYFIHIHVTSVFATKYIPKLCSLLTQRQ